MRHFYFNTFPNISPVPRERLPQILPAAEWFKLTKMAQAQLREIYGFVIRDDEDTDDAENDDAENQRPTTLALAVGEDGIIDMSIANQAFLGGTFIATRHFWAAFLLQHAELEKLLIFCQRVF